MSRLGCGLSRLLDASNGGLLSSSAARTGAATGLAAAADQIVKRLVKVGRHDFRCKAGDLQVAQSTR